MIRVALLGNPNSGKTSLFNNLTGLKQHVGNWPGKTIERKKGTIKTEGENIKIIDLPGIYSLNPYTPEEKVTKEFVTENDPDVIINILDATNLERNLYTTIQLLEYQQNIIIALNFNKDAKKQGIAIDEKIMSRELGVPVIKIEANEGMGKEELIKMIIHLKEKKKKNILRRQESKKERYEQIKKVIARSVTRSTNNGKNLTEKIDDLMLNKHLGIPIFLFIMFLIFYITFNLASPFVILINKLVELISNRGAEILLVMGAEKWMISLFKDGIIGGIGTIVVFLPNILTLFFLISILEDTGYMTRVAFMTDRLMGKLGLEGRSFIPLILGFGCNVPAILATRTLKGEKDRLLTMAMIPFISCSARLPIYVLFVGALFKQYQGLIIFSIYLLGIFVAMLTAFIFNRFIDKGSNSSFIMELAPYRTPTLKNTLIHTWEKGSEFISKAGTMIFSLVLVIWFLGNMPLGVEYASKESIIGIIGSFISPIFKPLGFGDWQSTVALLIGVVAKEVVIGTLGTLHGVGQEGLNLVIRHLYTPLSAYSFMVFTSLYIPCIATIATIKKESNWKWTMLIVSYVMAIAWVITFIIYRIGLMVAG